VLIIVAFTLVAAPGYGSALWEVVAGGPTRKEQEGHLARVAPASFESAMVWLLLLVFGGGVLYPRALRAMGTSLSAASATMIAAIALRALSFVVRSRVLSLLSLAAPVSMGLIVGVFSSGAVVGATPPSDGPPILWPVLIAALTLAIFGWLSAVRLGEASAPDDPDTEGRAMHAFRSRALLSYFATMVLAISAVFFAWTHATGVYRQLIGGPLSWTLQAAIAIASVGALHMVIRERWQWAFRLAAIQSGLIVAGGIVAAQAAAPAVFQQ